MSPTPASPLGFRAASTTPVAGLAMVERRVTNPEATIICVHGGLDRGGSFARLARRTENFDLVTYDRRGYQGSRALEPLGLDLHIEDLLAIERKESEHGPVILFGHSYGGVVVLGTALAEPSLSQLAVVYESPLPWILHRESGRPPLSDDPNVEAERFFRRMVSNSAWERLSQFERESRQLDGPALLSDLTSLRDTGAPFDLAKLKVPTVYVYGDGIIRDYYRALCVELAEVNPAIQCREFEDAGHGAHLSRPDQLVALFQELWSQVCASA
jgi:pimeloyl-ACP methyl ester carboxylesterase